MRNLSLLAIGALTLTWLAGPAVGDDPSYSKMPGTTMPGATTETANSQPQVIPQEHGPNCADNRGPGCGDEAGCGHFVGPVGVVVLKPHLHYVVVPSHAE